LETLHFYHPVVHWISRDVRNEREICCDRLALSITGGSRQEFAATLAQLGELREHPGALILAANGGVLFDRVQYMVLPEAPGTRKRAPARMVALLLGTALMAISLRLEWNHTRQQEALAAGDCREGSLGSGIGCHRGRVPAPFCSVARLAHHCRPRRLPSAGGRGLTAARADRNDPAEDAAHPSGRVAEDAGSHAQSGIGGKHRVGTDRGVGIRIDPGSGEP